MSWILRVRDKFQAAHFLKGYEGRCENVHGHSFQVEVTIEVRELDKIGLGIDFALIKKTLTEALPDHTLLNDIYEFNPSAENMARRLYEILSKSFPVKDVTVWESEDASATYSEDR
jgi:6-pyruvoyltetrahydropterin/6-carboxytetrahydropterin synthase